MRFPRVKAEGQSFYHCVSRVVDRQFIFQTTGHGSPEAERFVLLMRRLEAFSGVRVLTYALMSNHFHLLCEVPQAQDSLRLSYSNASKPATVQRVAKPWEVSPLLNPTSTSSSTSWVTNVGALPRA